MIYDCIVIGGGQAGLSSAYYLQKNKLNYILLDNQDSPGGAWLHTWDNLHLFSPADASSLHGYIMPKDEYDYPHRDSVIKYLSDYENRYKLNIERPVNVIDVSKENDIFTVHSDKGTYQSKSVISATGTWANPYIPKFEGIEKFIGKVIHSANYKNSDEFKGKKVLVIGAGNSAAQIIADMCDVATTYWATLNPPRFLPEDVDGRYLFSLATSYYREKRKNNNAEFMPDLGDIVQIPSVKKALEEGKLSYYPMFDKIDKNGATWGDTRLDFDAIIYCTGFKSSLNHLKSLGIENNSRVKTKNSKVIDIPGLYLMGYGNWTGFASATLIGIGRYAKEAVEDLKISLI